MNQKLKFTIIIPVWHGGVCLRDALDSLHRIDFPTDDFEIIITGVCDDEVSSSIIKTEIAKSTLKIRFICSPESHIAKMLNTACNVAKGQILVFADDDCVFREEWLKKLDEVFKQEPDLGIVGGVDELEPGASPFGLALDYVLKSFAGTGGIRIKSGLRTGSYYPKLWNMAIPYDVAFNTALDRGDEQAQVFDEALIVHVDVDLARRIEKTGKKIIFDSKIRIGHKRDTTFFRFTKTNFEKARTSRSLGIHRLSHMVLTTFSLSSLALLLTFLFSSFFNTLSLFALGSYSLILFITALRGFLHHKSFKIFILIPVLLISLHFARGFGYLFPLKNRKQIAE